MNKNTAIDVYHSQSNKITHEMFLDRIKSNFNEIIAGETLLTNIDSTDTNELKTILSLEYGESMNLFVKRADNEIISLIVKQTAKVKDLKQAIQSFYTTKKKSKRFEMTQVINWKYTWKIFLLRFGDELLIDENTALRDYGIQNRSILEFSRNFLRQN